MFGYSIAKELFWIFLGQIMMWSGGLIGVRLLTGVLEPRIYGELSLAMTLSILASQMLGPFSQAFLRFFKPAEETGQMGSYLEGVKFFLKQITLILTAGLSVICLSLFGLGQIKWLGLISGAFFFTLFSIYNSSLDHIQNAARQRLIVAWHQALSQWLRFLMAVSLIKLFGPTSSWAMLGFVLALLVVFSSQLFFFKRYILKKIATNNSFQKNKTRHWIKAMWDYSWPFMTWGIFTSCHLISDRWVLQIFGSAHEVGFYTVIYQLGYYPMTLLSNFVLIFTSPIIFERAGDFSHFNRIKSAQRLNKIVIKVCFVLTLIGTIFAFIFQKLIFFIFVDKRYHQVSTFLPVMVLSGGLFACGQVASLSLLTDFNSKGLIAPKIATALLGIIFNIFGAFWFRLKGIVFANLLFSLIYFFWIVTITNHTRNRKII